MQKDESPSENIVIVHNRWWLERDWTRVQERWYTVYDHWYPLITDTMPEDVFAVEADWFLAEVSLSKFQPIFQNRKIERIYEFRGEDAPASFEITPDLLIPVYTGDEGYWFSKKKKDWLIYASDQGSLTFAGNWLIRAIKEVWPTWEQHIWKGPGYVRPVQEFSIRPRDAFPGYEQYTHYARLLDQAQREGLWEKVKQRWQLQGGSYWYPLTGLLEEPFTDISYFETDWFLFKIPQNRLVEILKEHEVKHVIGFWEGGVAWEADPDLIELWYGGSEVYWTSIEMDWLIHTSHESSITVAGKWLLDAIKKAWPEWDQHIWGHYDYDPPEETEVYYPSEMLPGTF